MDGHIMKKFLSYFNMFEINLYSRSYKSGIIRMAVSLAIMLAAWAIRMSITIKDPTINIISAVVVFALMIPCVLCFFVAAVECLQVSDNIKKYNEREKK